MFVNTHADLYVLQAIWLYIKELAGKDLDISNCPGKFLMYYITPTLIPLIYAAHHTC